MLPFSNAISLVPLVGCDKTMSDHYGSNRLFASPIVGIDAHLQVYHIQLLVYYNNASDTEYVAHTVTDTFCTITAQCTGNLISSSMGGLPDFLHAAANRKGPLAACYN